jgi:type IV secretion system protein TrbG
MNKIILTLPVLLAACATQPPVTETEPPAPRPLYTAQALQVPHQTMPGGTMPDGKRPSRAEIGKMLKDQNEAALVLPNLNCFVGAACEYWYTPDGPPYLVMMEEGNKTDVQLQPGEIVTSIRSPGKQVRIPYEKMSFGTGPNRTERISFMPRVKGAVSYISIGTDRRVYDLRVETHKAGSGQQHIIVKWRYPDDVAAALNAGQPFDAAIDRTTGMDSRTRWCGYQIAAPNVPFAPVPTPDGQPPVCDDGKVTVINFDVGVLDGGGPTVYTVRDGIRYPVQYEQSNSTYHIAGGVHQQLLLSLGAYEVTIMRQPQK